MGEAGRLIAVGDIHGRNDLLRPLLDVIGELVRGSRRSAVVFLGDYVDRGPDSRGVIDSLLAFRRVAGCEVRFLRGNHDDTVLNFLADPAAGPTWIDYGGGATLESYGAPLPSARGDEAGWAATRAAFAELLPGEHRAFFEELEYCAEYGDYFFAHAGARPGVPLEDQSAQDLMWIRDSFLRAKFVWPKTIVHGHTPEEKAVVSHRRIGLDTGAYATGRLTAAVIEDDGCRLWQAVAAQGRVEIEGPHAAKLETASALK
ncbi:serine/threonine protein phosphatase [Phenylobacterium sp. J426]|uniref:metallophosphoesterase family protein n=1 Tax=Phenylobacterium sp. J426 TaxID=2898439 RepID=UPI0021509D50|nr:metallophosphoesterase family protein [Phenylobacterium sp. J426]MCR5876529.1 serine/threonine protein phosphatase [Phenylobacterium sp. J426]